MEEGGLNYLIFENIFRALPVESAGALVEVSPGSVVVLKIGKKSISCYLYGHKPEMSGIEAIRMTIDASKKF